MSFKLISHLLPQNDTEIDEFITNSPMKKQINEILLNHELCEKNPNLFTTVIEILYQIIAQPLYIPLTISAGIFKNLSSLIHKIVPNSSNSLITLSRILNRLTSHEQGQIFIKASKIYQPILSCLVDYKYLPILSKRTLTELGLNFEFVVQYLPEILEPMINMIIEMIKYIYQGIYSNTIREQNKEKPKEEVDSIVETYIGGYIENISQFLERFLVSYNHTNMFIQKRGLVFFLNILLSDEVPTNFFLSTGTEFFNRLFQNIGSQKISEVSQVLVNQTLEQLKKLNIDSEFLLKTDSKNQLSRFTSLVQLLF
ncbi:hypothetical protein M0811_14090 [Anaeramoeba ignava]|uniref:DUF913 domain-containing protein n=1 Tax=Anaeramoeba ignava TaxID=1746090 RepID=A0A9Q0LYF8_ANAIG|nr:hypothetical protein M0811_14090 [Anaeramoeba ignava]